MTSPVPNRRRLAAWLLAALLVVAPGIVLSQTDKDKPADNPTTASGSIALGTQPPPPGYPPQGSAYPQQPGYPPQGYPQQPQGYPPQGYNPYGW